MRWCHQGSRDRNWDWNVGLRCNQQISWAITNAIENTSIIYMRNSTPVCSFGFFFFWGGSFFFPRLTTKMIKAPLTDLFSCAPEFEVGNGVDWGKDKLVFDLVTPRNGQCTTQRPRLRSLYPPWQIVLRMVPRQHWRVSLATQVHARSFFPRPLFLDSGSFVTEHSQ